MSSATVDSGLTGHKNMPTPPPSRDELRRLIRSLPLSASERESRLIRASSLASAMLLHGLAATVMALGPGGPPPQKTALHGVPLASIEVVVLENEQKEELEPKAPLPTPEELLDLEPPPEAAAPPALEKLTAIRIPKPPTRRQMVAKQAVKQLKVTPAPANPTKVIMTTAKAAPTVEVAANGVPGAPNNSAATDAGSPTGTDVRTQMGSTHGVEAAIDLAGLRRAYMRRVSKRVHRRYKYPRSAARAGKTGLVLVEITIDGSGNIISSRIKSSSGHSQLDNAALRSIAKVGKLPAPPLELGWSNKRVTIPFKYSLRG
ncbi:MAG: TonB family protein [Myxococcota bacterium]|nr:TonB family protein [Myxococcota bacterium]